MKFTKSVCILALFAVQQASAQSSPEMFKGNWIRIDGSFFSTCTFGIEKNKITQQCDNELINAIQGAGFLGDSIVFSGDKAGLNANDRVLLKRNGNVLNGTLIRFDGGPPLRGTFVKQ
jgi:hypothetical protein